MKRFLLVVFALFVAVPAVAAPWWETVTGGTSTATPGSSELFLFSDGVDDYVMNTATLLSNSATLSPNVDHDQTTGFVAGEHFTQGSITTLGTVTSGDVSAIESDPAVATHNSDTTSVHGISETSTIPFGQEYIYVFNYNPSCNGNHLDDDGYDLSSAQAAYPSITITNVATLTTDSAALEEAIAVAEAAGKSVHAPACELTLSRTAQFNTASLQGYGATTSKITGESTLDDAYLELIGDKVALNGMHIYSPDKDGLTSQVCVYVGDPAGVAAPFGITVTGSYISECYSGIELGTGSSARFINNRYYANYYGVKINNILDSDQGDAALTDSHFTDEATPTSYSHVYIQQGSGLRVANTKFIKGNRGITVDGVVTSSVQSLLQLTNNSFENQAVANIKIDTADESQILNVLLANNETAMRYNSATNIDISNVNMLTVTGNEVFSHVTATGVTGLKLTNVDNFAISNNLFNGLNVPMNTAILIDANSSGIIGPNMYNSVTTRINNSSTGIQIVGDEVLDNKNYFGDGDFIDEIQDNSAHEFIVEEAFSLITRGADDGVRMVLLTGDTVTSGERLGYLLFGGDDTGGSPAGKPNAGGLIATATENWSASANGMKLEWYITNNGAGSRTRGMLLDQDGSLLIDSEAASYTGGSAYACFNNSGLLYSSETACP